MSDVYAGFPKKVKIGQFYYDVVITTETEEPALKGCNGLCDLGAFKIFLERDLPLQMALNVAQHEVTHAINELYGVTDKSSEEVFTTQHTHGLVEFWLQNPKFVTWQQKAIRSIKAAAKEPK